MQLNVNRLMRGGDGLRSRMTFGAAYAVASLSCTLAVLLSVSTALASGALEPGLRRVARVMRALRLPDDAAPRPGATPT